LSSKMYSMYIKLFYLKRSKKMRFLMIWPL